MGFHKLICYIQFVYYDRVAIDSGYFYPGNQFNVFLFPWLELGDCLMDSIHQW